MIIWTMGMNLTMKKKRDMPNKILEGSSQDLMIKRREKMIIHRRQLMLYLWPKIFQRDKIGVKG